MKSKKLVLPLLVLLVLVVVVAVLGWWERISEQDSPLPSPTLPGEILPIDPSDPGFSDDFGQPPAGQSSECGIEQCHGLEVTCGPNMAMVCTMEYRLGDFCRQYIDCAVIDGQCERVDQPQFAACKACLEACIDADDPMGAFECEEICRAQM